MTIHKLKLHKEPFSLIKSGKKTIELRLYDEKRRGINVKDLIEFSESDNPENTLLCEVLNLHIYSSFEELYSSLPLTRCGYTESNIAMAKASDMRLYYSEADEKTYGVLGIEIKLLDTNMAHVFDLDGTLIDSMPACRRAMISLAEDDGVEYDEKFVDKIIPLGFIDGAKYYIDTFGIERTVEEVCSLMAKKLYFEYKNNIRLKDGAEEYLKKLKSEGRKLYILTANSHTLADVCLENNRVFDLFDNVWSVEDFGINKASPDLFLKLAEKIGCHPCEINYYDDSITALRNASLARLKIFGAYDNHSDEDIKVMKNELGCAVITDFKELL